MNKRFIQFSLIVFTLSACSGGVGSAYRDYEKGRYGDALMKLADAEIYRRETPPHLDVQIAFLKASIFEKQDKPDEARGMYKYIVEHYPTDKLGYAAKERLDSIMKAEVAVQ